MQIKKLVTLAASGLLVVQMLGIGTALAASGPSECNFGSDNLEVTVGDDDVYLYIDNEENDLVCDVSGGATETQRFATIDSVTVEMDDDDESDGELFIQLDDYDDSAKLADWPDFDTFDVNLTTTLNFDASTIDNKSDNPRVVIGAKSVSFSGTTFTYSAPEIYYDGAKEDDYVDASKATVDVEAWGYEGDDTLKGGSGDDELFGGDSNDTLYGGAGDDTIKGNFGGANICWGQDGNDFLKDCLIAGPGAGDDMVETSARISYADLTEGITASNLAGWVTGGAAGDDDIAYNFDRFYGSAGDDVIADPHGSILERIYGNAGDDYIKSCGLGDLFNGKYVSGGDGNDKLVACDGSDDVLLGGGGSDVLKGMGGSDTLRGGPGSDQTWGGIGIDYCRGEVTNSCEFLGRVEK